MPRSSRGAVRALPGAVLRAPRRLAQLSPGELLLLLQAPLALPAAAGALHRWGLGAVQRRLVLDRIPATGLRTDRAAAERLAWVVQVSAAYGPWPATCLPRSVVLCWFLRRRGLEGELRIGVRHGRDRPLDFHAWVEHDGAVVGDASDAPARYAVFPGAVVPPGARFR